jgi:hypothetical protein
MDLSLYLFAASVESLCGDVSEKERLIDNIIADIKDMDKREIFMKLIDDDDFTRNRKLFTDLLFRLCPNHEKSDIQKSVDKMARVLSVDPIYPGDIHHLKTVDKNGEYRFIDDISIAIERGEDIRTVYERMADEILEDDPYTKCIVEDQTYSVREAIREGIIAYLSKSFKKYVEPLLPEFKAERQRCIDEVLSYLD